MNTEELRRIRNKNVQQQNMLAYLEMEREAEHFRSQPQSHPWLLAVLERFGQEPTGGLLLSCSSVPEQGGMQWMGTWLTSDKRFFEFDVMADYSSGELLEVDQWYEYQPTVSAHCKGIGKSHAYIALELLGKFGKVIGSGLSIPINPTAREMGVLPR